MINQITTISDAIGAWEPWNFSSFEYKRECLLRIKGLVKKANQVLADSMDFHLQRAEDLLAVPYLLNGPTGETNELYTSGRGVTLLICGSDENNPVSLQQAAFSLLTSALLAGNSLVICTDEPVLIKLVNDITEEALLPEHLVQRMAYDDFYSLIDTDIRAIAYVGDRQTAQEINRQTAKRTGPIIGLVAETNLDTLAEVADPYLVLRFITERTRTINITAVGGNATLLELGSDAH